MRNSGMPPSRNFSGGAAPVKMRHQGRPMSEADSMLEEMKFKQQQREKQKQLQKELQNNATQIHSQGPSVSQSDIVRMRQVQSQLAQVDNFLLKHDDVSNAAGVQQLPSLANPSMLPINHPAFQSPVMTMQNQLVQDNLTTNLYVTNISTTITEEMLSSIFSQFGHAESVKIMLPRTDEQRFRALNAGFVQMTTRAQAEKARNALNGKEIQGVAIHVEFATGRSAGWQTALGALPTAAAGQLAMQIGGMGAPTPALGSTATPGTAAGPGNWKPSAKVIEVLLPAQTKTRRLIDLTAEFVAQEGWELEKVIASREKANKRFRFLQTKDEEDVAKQDPLNIYYRWRVFSFLQGDTKFKWRTAPCQLYTNGPLWQPPPCCNAPPMQEQGDIPGGTTQAMDPAGPTSGVLQRLANQVAAQNIVKQGHPIGLRSQASGLGGKPLTEEESIQLDELLYYNGPGRKSVGELMRFAIDNSASSKIIAEKIVGSILHAPTASTKRLKGKLYCTFDVLANSHASKPGASLYRRQFHEMLPDIFQKIRKLQDEEKTDLAELKTTLAKILEIWTESSIFPPLFVKGLESTLNFDEKKLATPPENLLLQSKLQHWTAMSDILQLEKGCRLRGLQPIGTKHELVDRLCFFETYWYEKGVEAAELAAAERAAAGEAEEQQGKIEFDPELDGEALDDDDMKAVAEIGMREGSDDEGERIQPLKTDKDRHRKDRSKREKGEREREKEKDEKEAADAKEKAEAAEAEASAPGREGGSIAPSQKPKDELDDVFGPGDAPINLDEGEEKQEGKDEEAQPTPEDDVDAEFQRKKQAEEKAAEKRRARLRKVEVQVMQFQMQMEKERACAPDQMQLLCDRKRMELLEEISNQEAFEEMERKDKEKQEKRRIMEEKFKAEQPSPVSKVPVAKAKKKITKAQEENFSLFSPQSEDEAAPQVKETPAASPKGSSAAQVEKYKARKASQREEREDEEEGGTASPEWQSKVVKKAQRVRKGVDVSDRTSTTVGTSATLKVRDPSPEKLSPDKMQVEERTERRRRITREEQEDESNDRGRKEKERRTRKEDLKATDDRKADDRKGDDRAGDRKGDDRKPKPKERERSRERSRERKEREREREKERERSRERERDRERRKKTPSRSRSRKRRR